MARIAFLVDIEQGHILSTFSLARKLKARGHEVFFLGVADVEEMIRKQGMEFRALLQDLMPVGSVAKLRAEYLKDQQSHEKIFFYIKPLLEGTMLDSTFQELRPDVVVIGSFFEAIAIRYKYNVPVVMWNPTIRKQPRAEACQSVIQVLIEVPGACDLVGVLESAGVRVRNFADIANLVLTMPELAFIPKAFELPDRVEDENVFYIGPEIDLERAEVQFEWNQLAPDRPLIYCSLGSQLDIRHEVSRRFIRTVIDAVAGRPEWQLVVSLGSRMEPDEFMPVPSHVYLSRWAPQLQMLSRASVMITHAGAGATKECIINGVPMLAVPMMRDQFDCAERIVYHGLGLRADIEHINAAEVCSMLEHLLADGSCRARVNAMREEFRRVDAMNVGVELIEKIAAGRLPGKYFVAHK
ncbi:MAG TPA: nucleotide disphospho-sugar-binding domain-containing protein [Pyrinomonadaceae bacterium]